MSEIKVNSIVDASGGSTVQVNGFTPTVSNMAGRNRIINGDMRVAQRGTSAVTSNSGFQYPVDRFFIIKDSGTTAVMTAQQDSSAPAGFVNSVKLTTTTAQASLSGTDYHRYAQNIEGLNVADLGWGTANAKPVTLSFWVRSSLTGTFGGSLGNSAWNRTYPFTYTISVADTWEQKSITIAGDTSGTWLSTNGIGLRVDFGLGVGTTYSGTAGAWAGALYISATGATNVSGTLNATFYITGVQLEEGSVATPFEHRQYGQELALCQRYYYKAMEPSQLPGSVNSMSWRGNVGASNFRTTHALAHKVTMRASPLVILYNPVTGGTGARNEDAATNVTATPYIIGTEGVTGIDVGSSSAGQTILLTYVASAEL